MIFALTTGQCAEFLNEQAGMSAYTSAFILTEIRNGELTATEIKGGSRRRAYVRVNPRDFRRYLATHYPQYVAAFDQSFTFHNDLAS